jgi:hypothetical protein
LVTLVVAALVRIDVVRPRVPGQVVGADGVGVIRQLVGAEAVLEDFHARRV